MNQPNGHDDGAEPSLPSETTHFVGRISDFERVKAPTLGAETDDESVENLHETIRLCCRSAIKRADALPRSERDSSILIARYGLGVEKLTLDEIANSRGVTRQLIAQQEIQALKHLKESGFLRSGPVRAHLAWLTFNDGIILPGTELPKLTLAVYRLLNDVRPSDFRISCHDEDGVVVSDPWPCEAIIAAFTAFPKTFKKSGLDGAKQSILQCIPFAADTSQYSRVAEKILHWADTQQAELVVGSRTSLVRAALERIGGTAHFSRVAREAAAIENKPCTAKYERNIHAALGLYPELFARPGGDGMYALASDGVATTDGLAEEMRKIVDGNAHWMSPKSVWDRLPKGHCFKLTSVPMTASQFPQIFRVASFGLIASAKALPPDPPEAIVTAVAAYLAKVRSATRAELHRDLASTIPTDAVDTVLAFEKRVLRIGSLREQAFIYYIRPLEKPALKKRAFAEMLMHDFSLLSLTDAARYAMDHYGISINVRK